MASMQLPFSAVVKLVRDAQTVNRSGVAAVACFAFDIMITLDQEVQYIWKSRWTLPKFLYIFARYYTLFVQVVSIAEATSFNVTDDFCQKLWTSFTGVSGQLIVMCVEIILMLRVWALYQRDRRILALIIALFIAEVTANSVILGISIPKIVSVAPLKHFFPPGFPLSGCFPTFVPDFFFSYWIPTLIFESVLFILMVARFIGASRAQKKMMPLLVLFFRDGTVFYAVIFSTLLTQVLLYELVNSALAQVAISWQLTMFGITGSRLILNLRAAGAARSHVESLEMMRFQKPPPHAPSPSRDTQSGSATMHSARSMDIIQFRAVESLWNTKSTPETVSSGVAERGTESDAHSHQDNWIAEWEHI